MPPDAERVRVEIQGQRIAHLVDTGAVQIEALVVGARVLVVGADDIAPGTIPQGAGDVVLQPVVGPEQVPGESATEIVEDVAALLASDDGPGRPLSVFTQASIVMRSAFSITGLSSTRRRGPLSKRMHLPHQSALSRRSRRRHHRCRAPRCLCCPSPAAPCRRGPPSGDRRRRSQRSRCRHRWSRSRRHAVVEIDLGVGERGQARDSIVRVRPPWCGCQPLR